MTTEPRVEELLATIRRAIDRDISQLDARELSQTPPLRGTIIPETPPQRVLRDADTDISSLRQRVQRNKLDLPTAAPRPVLRSGPELYIPSQQSAPPQTYSQPAQEPMPYYEPQAAWSEAHAEVAENFDDSANPQALVSHQTAYAAQASFQALANAMMGQLGGEAGLQDTARTMLRPMLKQWLDDNLPGLVEKLVRDEIERVARRGR